jgi:predicted nucleic acid-binding protein
MDRYHLLDSGPLGLAICRRGTKNVDEWRGRLAELELARLSILIPAVTDDEVRRLLVRLGATATLRNLENLLERSFGLPVSEAAWFRAAEYWALSRRKGVPTGSDAALDADAILAGCAATVGRTGDEVIIASNNIRHLSRFPGIDAREWTSIRP